MLIKRADLERIKAETISLAFRKWKRPTVRAGGRLRTAIGELSIDALERVTPQAITERDARRAGFASKQALLGELRTQRDGTLYRIRLHLAGPDKRELLRQTRALSYADLHQVRRQLTGLDRRSSRGPWTTVVLQEIDGRPGVRAAELAARLGWQKTPLKVSIRKLKELGLTESLTTGYRLSPRGRKVLLAVAKTRSPW